MRSWTRWTVATVATVAVSTGLSTVGAMPGAGAQNSTTCPLNALAKASKPVEITMWHWMARKNETTLGTIKAVLGGGNDPNVELGVAPMPGPGRSALVGGVFNQGGELFMVNKSATAKQAAAWKFLKFLAEPENVTVWAIGTGYIPIRTSSASSAEMQDYWAQNPDSRAPTTSSWAGRTPSPRPDR